MALASTPKVPVVALKLADDPDPTFMVTGTLRLLLSLPTVTVIPPAGTDFDRDTVHALLAFGPRLVGLQANELIVRGDTKLTVALAEEPL